MQVERADELDNHENHNESGGSTKEREAGGSILKQERIAHSLLNKVSENTREMIKSFETRRLRTCSWGRKGDNSRAREKRRKTNLSAQADSQGHVSHYHVLMSRVLPVGR